MSFISYNLLFYKSSIEYIESFPVDEHKIYLAKQLLKIIDDLVDENYLDLKEEVEKSFNGVNRLYNFLKVNNQTPFITESTKKKLYSYSSAMPLDDTIRKLINNSVLIRSKSNNNFLEEIVNFSKWIGNDKDTTYVFLLRDTLLNYIYHITHNGNNAKAWLLSRKSINNLAKDSLFDDKIRACIYDTLENYESLSFIDFINLIKNRINLLLERYDELKKILLSLLNQIKTEHIIVVDSGCIGSFPLLLMSLDDRVDLRLYSTYPYLYDLYNEKIYTKKYENIRKFETLFSQDIYLEYDNYNDHMFYAKNCLDSNVVDETLKEINRIIQGGFLYESNNT